jgi:hypothetical protein
VEVRKTRGINVVVSPHDRQQFLENAQRALDSYRTGPTA